MYEIISLLGVTLYNWWLPSQNTPHKDRVYRGTRPPVCSCAINIEEPENNTGYAVHALKGSAIDLTTQFAGTIRRHGLCRVSFIYRLIPRPSIDF
jgi:hypothetical protein